jgi:hypothetical protein
MTRKDKELLLKDLSCRIPYGVIVNVNGISNVKLTSVSWYGEVGVDDGSTYLYPISEIKPYLFPLSSMTEEQKQEYTYIVNYISPDDTENWKEGEFIYVEQFSQLMHFYHINHLDYMGLIPKGLAIDATNLNVY